MEINTGQLITDYFKMHDLQETVDILEDEADKIIMAIENINNKIKKIIEINGIRNNDGQ